ncbi:hypothetical protein SBOR_9757 [Sclerotinia borealis F-4128]|uniref:Uncharacterized protein n=1 Tax=Sclerotinia borealis (strain F-4128) TaxID=1432307 RepID=W9C1V9_SCLBF|nr:hypothetical protein SBOR_9757 [Sclerotinia borealis F-4128]
MASRKRIWESFAEGTYKPSQNDADLPTMIHRTSRRSTVSTPTSTVVAIKKRDINESPHDFGETIATLKSPSESVAIRALQETADEQAWMIQAMRSRIDANALWMQRSNRKISRRDKRVAKLRKRLERANIALLRADWSKSEAIAEVGTKHNERVKVLRNKRPASADGPCTKCGENCIWLVKENQQLRNRLHEVDGLCIRLRTECSKLESKIRGLESKVDEIRG